MTDFSRYQLHMDTSRPIRNWTELREALDGMEPSIAPTPCRSPIGMLSLDLSWKNALKRKFFREEAATALPRGWQRVVAHRQRVTLAMGMATTAGILYLSYLVMKAQELPQILLDVYLAVYGVMSFFLTSSFYRTMLGTWHALRGADGNPWHPAHTACDPSQGVRAAIVFPTYDEEPARLGAGVAATWEALAARHPEAARLFDIFILSDSRTIESAILEEEMLFHLRESFPDGRFFYRRRLVNRNAKMGNILDFCRRWGASYDFMLVMDADSVMDGEAIFALLRMMCGNPQIGIIQTNPVPVLRTSLFGRMQQFSARLYGSVFSYSLQSMYMGNASYIGHNAIVRLSTFMRHCSLPVLSGPKPWGGKPMSHDIVESAMMARAGQEVWFLPEVGGSYEEVPANLLAYLIRERRWMQGNLQHLRMVFAEGIKSIHRETFITGSMGYLAAPLWAFFLLISAYGMFHFLDAGVVAMHGVSMLEMPLALLFVSSLVFLFVPRLLALAIHIHSAKADRFGGKDKLIWSILLETAFSLLFSPVQMIAISRFLWQWLKRKSVAWGVQARGDEPLQWRECLRHFSWISMLGVLGLGIIVRRLNDVPPIGTALLQTFSSGLLTPGDLVIWFVPVLVGFAACVLIARVTSQTFPSVARCRIFTTPEELEVPPVIAALARWQRELELRLPRREHALRYALTDPGFYVRHRAETRFRSGIYRQLIEKIRSGERIEDKEYGLALMERRCFDALHDKIGAEHTAIY